MRIEFTEYKGSKLAIFRDAYDVECSFQGDLIQGHRLMWLGCNTDLEGKPTHRMLLDKERAKILVEVLKLFIQEEKVPICPADMPSTLNTKKIEDSPSNPP